MADRHTPKQKYTPKEAEARIAELTEALQRERADSINMRRQHETALSNIRELSISKVIRELLPAIDNLERALKHVPQELKGHDYVRGIQAVVKQFENDFEGLGVKRIKTVGEPFDPRLHEAVHLDDTGDGEREVVSEELQSGYMIGDEVIRHAMVNVRLEH
jgi:molecular chaperone GrpE